MQHNDGVSKILQEFSLAVIALSLPLVASGDGAQAWDLAALRAFASLTADQWKAVDRGEVQARVLDTREKREVAVVGVARLHATASCFAAKFEDIETFKKNPAVLKIQKFARPADLRDLEGFSVDMRDLADLRNCQAGDCKLKLSAKMIERLFRETHWNQPDYDTQVESILRQALLTYIDAYTQQGDSALIEYRDKTTPVRLAPEFHEVLHASPGLGEIIPEFRDYLELYVQKPRSKSRRCQNACEE